MAEVDLERMSKSELLQLRDNLDRALRDYDTRRRKKALAAAEATAREMGFSLVELTGAKGSSKRSAHPPKYRHPDDPSLTWSGRGRQPGWIKDGLDAGKSLDDYLIQQ